MLATRVDPPLPLARMRARGELAELRVADLEFTEQEASALLNGAMGLRLATEDVERLAERTEGWAAGLVLAGLSLRGRQDASAFIASFHGDNRHVADFLAAEVLARQPEEIRSVPAADLDPGAAVRPVVRRACWRPKGRPRCWRELERSNLFLVPLDDHRQWYRYHHLFARAAAPGACQPRARAGAGAASAGRGLAPGRPATWMRPSTTPARPGSSPRRLR